MSRIEFIAQNRIGDRHLDDQRQMLFCVSGLLDDAVAQGADRLVFNQVYEILAVILEQHFFDEEALMAKRQCFGIDIHRSEHRDLVQELHQLWRGNLDGKPEVIGTEIASWLNERLFRHMTETDLEMFPASATGTKV